MDSKFKKLLISYLEKDISKEDEMILVQWFKENPGERNEITDIRKIWELSGSVGNFDKSQIEREWFKLLKQLEITSSETSKNKGLFLYWLPRIAAVFLFGAMVSFAVSYRLFNPKVGDSFFNEISAPSGAKSKITLPDGSTIWLNAGSIIKYSSEYGKKQREIVLTGEAFFEVMSNKRKVFLVKTEDLNIKAYGTSFNVKSYPEENTVETTLIEGSIGVTRTKFADKKLDEVMLEPNQRVVYYKPIQKIEKEDSPKEIDTSKTEPEERETQKLTYMISKGIDPKPFTAWKDGTLFIASETLQQLAVKLERKYDVKIQFEDEGLKKLKFTGSLENETIEQVIHAIGIAAHINYEIEDRDILLKNKTN